MSAASPDQNKTAPPPPWHAAYPAPSNPDPPAITGAELLERVQQGQRPGKDFVLVDLRRADHEVRG